MIYGMLYLVRLQITIFQTCYRDIVTKEVGGVWLADYFEGVLTVKISVPMLHLQKKWRGLGYRENELFFVEVFPKVRYT